MQDIVEEALERASTLDSPDDDLDTAQFGPPKLLCVGDSAAEPWITAPVSPCVSGLEFGDWDGDGENASDDLLPDTVATHDLDAESLDSLRQKRDRADVCIVAGTLDPDAAEILAARPTEMPVIAVYDHDAEDGSPDARDGSLDAEDGSLDAIDVAPSTTATAANLAIPVSTPLVQAAQALTGAVHASLSRAGHGPLDLQRFWELLRSDGRGELFLGRATASDPDTIDVQPLSTTEPVECTRLCAYLTLGTETTLSELEAVVATLPAALPGTTARPDSVSHAYRIAENCDDPKACRLLVLGAVESKRYSRS